MNASKVIFGIIAAVVVVLVVAIAINSFGKQSVKITGGITLPSSNTTTYPTVAAHPYLSAAQAEGIIGVVQATSVKVYNTSAEISQLSPSLAANASAVWSVSYGGVNNSSLIEQVVESPKAEALFSSLTSNVHYHPGYITGTYGGMSYLEIPYNQTMKEAGIVGQKNNYVVLALIYNDSTASVSSLISAVADGLP